MHRPLFAIFVIFFDICETPVLRHAAQPLTFRNLVLCLVCPNISLHAIVRVYAEVLEQLRGTCGLPVGLSVCPSVCLNGIGVRLGIPKALGLGPVDLHRFNLHMCDTALDLRLYYFLFLHGLFLYCLLYKCRTGTEMEVISGGITALVQ